MCTCWRHFFGLSAKLIKRPSHSYDKWPLGRGISIHFRELWYLSFVRDEIMIFLWQITTSSVILIIKSTRFVWIRTVLILLSYLFYKKQNPNEIFSFFSAVFLIIHVLTINNFLWKIILCIKVLVRPVAEQIYCSHIKFMFVKECLRFHNKSEANGNENKLIPAMMLSQHFPKG